MRLGDFLKTCAEDRSPWNCSTMPADWCVALGHPDYAAAWRDIVEPSICEAVADGDLLGLWNEGIGDALPTVDVLKEGDIAVVGLGPLKAGAIWTGERFAIRTQRGIHFAQGLDVLKAWRPL